MALWLIVASLVLGAANGIAVNGLPTRIDWIIGGMIGIGILAGLLVATARGRSWARWVWVIFYVLGLLTSIEVFRFAFEKGATFGLIQVVVGLLQGTACSCSHASPAHGSSVGMWSGRDPDGTVPLFLLLLRSR
jgi:hypothetical protein